MPRALNPNSRFPVVLDSDASSDPKPTFWFRFLTGAEFMELDDAVSSQQAAGTARDLAAPVYTVLRMGLVDWTNLRDHDGNPIPYQPADLERFVDYGEACELAVKMRTGCMLSEGDLKKLGSPSASPAASSVESAEEPASRQTKSSD